MENRKGQCFVLIVTILALSAQFLTAQAHVQEKTEL